MSLRVVLTLRVHEGAEARFEELWRGHSDVVHRFPDNLGQQLLRRVDGEQGYVIISDWTDEDSFRRFERSPEQQEYLERLWPLRLAGSMTLTEAVFEVTEAVFEVTEAVFELTEAVLETEPASG